MIDCPVPGGFSNCPYCDFNGFCQLANPADECDEYYEYCEEEECDDYYAEVGDEECI